MNTEQDLLQAAAPQIYQRLEESGYPDCVVMVIEPTNAFSLSIAATLSNQTEATLTRKIQQAHAEAHHYFVSVLTSPYIAKGWCQFMGGDDAAKALDTLIESIDASRRAVVVMTGESQSYFVMPLRQSASRLQVKAVERN